MFLIASIFDSKLLFISEECVTIVLPNL